MAMFEFQYFNFYFSIDMRNLTAILSLCKCSSFSETLFRKWKVIQCPFQYLYLNLYFDISKKKNAEMFIFDGTEL